MRFLHLPNDVLAYLLDLVPMTDLESVSKTCRTLKNICALVRAPYFHELNKEGLQYNATSASPILSFPQALASLRHRENSWRTMRPVASSCRETLNGSHFISYSQKVVLYVSRQLASTVVHGDILEHATYHGQADEVTRLHAADAAQDLLILLWMHVGTGLSYLCFLSLRGMSTHPEAASPTRLLLTGISPMGYFSPALDASGLRILGPWCAVLTSNAHHAQINTLLLCNWKTNALFKLAGFHPDKVDDFDFINDHTLAVIHRTSNSCCLILRIYDITLPNHTCPSGHVRLCSSLQLPRIDARASTYSSRMFLPRALQEHVLLSHQRPREFFSPNTGIMALSIPLVMDADKAQLAIAIDIAMLLSIARYDDSPLSPSPDCAVPWDEWGPKISRAFFMDDTFHGGNGDDEVEPELEPVQDVEGYRVAFSARLDSGHQCRDDGFFISQDQIQQKSNPGPSETAFILDFNPASIRWARAEGSKSTTKAGGESFELMTEPSILRSGRFLAEKVVGCLPFMRTRLSGYLPLHQIRLLRDEVVYPANPMRGPPLPLLHNVYSFV